MGHGVLSVISCIVSPRKMHLGGADLIAPFPQDFPEGSIILEVVSVLVCQLRMN